MKRYINYLLLSIFLATMSSCSDDAGITPGAPPSDNESVVTVSADFAAWSPLSRSVSVPQKTVFEDGDVIHVQGEFVTSGEEKKVLRYGIYRYSGGRWAQVSDDSVLKWPWNAITGSFTAYYLPALKEALPNGESYTCEMGGDYSSHDPLVADTADVARDFAVNFKFRHMCTRLVIENTKNNYAEEYWFYKEGISNVLKLGFDSITNRLGLSFKSDANINDGTISSVKVMTSDTGETSNAGYVVYYLQPGKYYGSDLNYSGNRLYLKLNVDALDAPNGSDNGLEAGKTYFLDIEKARGVVNVEETEDPWDDEDPPVKLTDVQGFIDAVNDGKEYGDILKLDNAGNLVLTKNLDFDYQDFIPKEVHTNICLNGGYHYIMNTKHQLVDRNYGAIRNLEIRNAKIESYYDAHAGKVGALVAENFGYIDNIRLRDNEINLPALPISENVTSVGGLVGSHNGGQITNVYMIGRQTMSISNPESGDAIGHVLFGGIAGQISGPSSPAISNVSMQQDANGASPVISLKLNCSKGIYSVGGVGGQLSTGIENCTLATEIDCSGSDAANCYVGGLFGSDQVGHDGGFKISTCNVTGTVRGAHATTVNSNGNTVPGRSLVGGIGGAVQLSDITITDCRSFCEVYDCFNSGKGYSTGSVIDEVFGSGAAFGRLTASPMSVIRRCTAWGQLKAETLGATESKGGCFAGSFVGYAINGFEKKVEYYNMDNTIVNGAFKFCGYSWNVTSSSN